METEQGVKKDFASRVADVFGALGAGTTKNWALRSSPAPFQAGRDVTEADSDEEEDEEAAQIMPQSLIDSDDEEEQGQKRRRRAGHAQDEQEEGEEDLPPLQACNVQSAAFRRQFEQEEEEDEYDRLADEGWDFDVGGHGEDAAALRAQRPSRKGLQRPPGCTEVPDDYRRRDVDSEEPEPAHATAAAASAPATQPQGEDMAVDRTLSAPAAGEVEAAAPAGRASVFSRLRRPGGDAPSQPRGLDQQQQQQGSGEEQAGRAGPSGRPGSGDGSRQVKRVRFADAPDAAERDEEVERGEGRRGGSGGAAGQLQRRRGGGQQGQQGRGGRVVLNWQRPGYVPEHVKHPERFTVYDLGESLTVGAGHKQPQHRGGGAGRAPGGLRRGDWDAGVGGGGDHEGAQGQGGGVEAGREGPGVAEGEAAAQEEPRQALAFGAGAVRFTRRAERQPAAAASGGDAAAAAHASGGAAKAGVVSFGGMEEEDADGGGERPAAEGAKPAVFKGGGGGGRQFRASKAARGGPDTDADAAAT